MPITPRGGSLLADGGRREPGWWNSTPRGPDGLLSRSVVVLLTVDLSALTALGLFLPDWRMVSRAGAFAFALLVLGAVLHVETARVLEGRRRVTVTRRPHVDLESSWAFAALLLVPLGPALLLVILTSAHSWWRTRRRAPAHLWGAITAATLLATCAAGLELREMPVEALLHGAAGPAGVAALALVAATRWLVSFLLVAGVVAAVRPRAPWSTVLGTRIDLLLSSGTIVLGVALAMVSVRQPWLVPVLALPLFAMYREAQLQELARLAVTDDKTGLSTAAAWHAVAHRLLARARRRRGGPHGFGVLMIDLDEFKSVNDRYGHVAGDTVLRAVAEVLLAEVRPIDVAGRFGGEEFVVLLADLRAEEAVAMADRTAERIRARVTRLTVELDGSDGSGGSASHRPDAGTAGASLAPVTLTDLSISVGVAAYPQDADSVDALVLAADTALYAAKRSGRNCVLHAAAPTVTASPPADIAERPG